MKRRTMILRTLGVLALTALPAMAQQATTDQLEVSGGFVRASPSMASAGAGFMTITSKGDADRLIAFRSTASEVQELHTHIHDNGMMRMRQVDAIDIPAGGVAVLEPGGFHLMFISLNAQLIEGETVDVTLVFENAGEVEITLPVKGPGAME